MHQHDGSRKLRQAEALADATHMNPTADTIARDAGAMLAKGLFSQALDLLRPARLSHPLHPAIALHFADALHASGQLAGAVVAYTAALRLNENSAETRYGAGCAHLALKAYGNAAACLLRAVAIAPRSGAAHYNLAKSLFELGHVERAVAHFERTGQLDPGLAEMAAASIACIVPGSQAADHRMVLQARRHWVRHAARGLAKSNSRAIAGLRAGKIRVGYLSAFFGKRNWMKPVFALINRHDRAQFVVHMFCDGQPPASESGYRDHAADIIHDLTGVENDRAAGIIAEAGIDILVDLNGYSFPSRLPVLMRRAAPHIVGWFNMFATTGIDAFDWLVGDDAVIRRVEEQYYSERIHRLPGTYLAFEVLYDVPDVTSPPCASGAEFTFGCLGSHYKLTDATLSAWADILGGAPQAKLFLKNGTLEDASVRQELLDRMALRDIDPRRITLAGRSEHFAFLDAYRHVDIALDTFPYNGGTTTTEALWQGVPVLAFDGDRWAARTSKSLLFAAGLQDWVMPNVTHYVERAIALANDVTTPAMLADLRCQMRERLRASPACDADQLRVAMESFFTSLVASQP